MDASAPHAIRGRWQSYTVGVWCEGDTCTMTLMESVTVIYADGTWFRSAHDPEHPLRAWSQSNDDPGVNVTADELMTRFRAYASLPAPVEDPR